MFADASAFNGDISGWDVSQGTSFVSILHYNCFVFILTNRLTIIFILFVVIRFRDTCLLDPPLMTISVDGMFPNAETL